MSEILSQEQHAALVNDLMISAMEDIDLGRNEAGIATLARQSLLVAQFAAIRLALATATKEAETYRAEHEGCIDIWRKECETVRAERDAAVARLNATEALLLDVWDSHHREGWEQTETFDSVMDRLSDWRWNNGFDPHNPPLRTDPRKKGAPE